MAQVTETLILLVRTKSETTVPVKIKRKALVSELKLQLEIKHGIESGRFSFKNKSLEEDKSLSYYNINNGAVLQVEGNEDKEEIIKLLGRGGFGEVHLISKNGHQLVNKKVKLSELNEKCRQLAIQEMKLLENLNHPNIVSYEGGYFKHECLHILMEYCAGGDLASKIKGKKEKGILFKEQEIVPWIKKIAEGLAYIHNRKIIHRDIKPPNIFLSSSGTIKIGDFGISRELGEATRASTLIGTPMYTAPEAYNDGFTTKSDMFSLGCCAYELAALKSNYPYIKVVLHDSFSDSFKSLAVTLLDHNPLDRPEASSVLENPLFMTEVQKQVTAKVFRRRTTTTIARVLMLQTQTPKTLVPLSSHSRESTERVEDRRQITTEKECSQVLSNFSTELEAGNPVDKSKVIEEIIYSMKTYQQSLDMQLLGCSALSFISRSEDRNVLKSAIKEEIESVLLTSLENHSDDFRILILCSVRLNELGKRHQLILKAEQLVPKVLQYIQDAEVEVVCRQAMYIIYLITSGIGITQYKIMKNLGTIKVLMNVILDKSREHYHDRILSLFFNIACSLTDETPSNCETFVAYHCIPLIIDSLTMDTSMTDFQMSAWITLSNISEVKELRPQLMQPKILKVLVSFLSTSEYTESVSSEAAQILVNLLSDGEKAWSVVTPQRHSVMQTIVEAIETWDLDATPPCIYRTFRPLWELIKANHTPVCQYWAIWTLAKLTRVQPDRYCPMIEEERGIDRLLALVQSSTTSLSQITGSLRKNFAGQLSATILQLTGKIINACEDYKKYKGSETKNWNLVKMLIEAARDGELEDVEELLEADVYLNSKSVMEKHEGRTSLHFATERGHIDVVCALLTHGAFVHAADIQGMTALHIAAWEGHIELVKLLLLFDANPDVEAKSKGWKAVHFAATRGHLHILRYLKETCDLKSPTRDKKTALHLAAENGRENVVSWLLHEGFNINQKDAKLLTAVDYATQKKHTNIVKMLKDFTKY